MYFIYCLLCWLVVAVLTKVSDVEGYEPRHILLGAVSAVLMTVSWFSGWYFLLAGLGILPVGIAGVVVLGIVAVSIAVVVLLNFARLVA